ncbi:MAG: hypothetical protein ACFFD4_07755 [Candidatus Odinarchaeota archaeon]
MAEEKKPVRTKLTILEVKPRQLLNQEKGTTKLAFRAGAEDGEHWYYTFRTSLFETIENGIGSVLDCEILTTESEQWGTQRDCKQIYVDGQPVGGKKQGGGGWRSKSPEELELARGSYALSYAKDLAMVDKIKVSDIITKAEEFHDWLKSDKSGTIPTTTEHKKGSIEHKKDTPEDDQGFLPNEHTDNLLQWVADNMKFKSQKTARNWIVNVCKIENDRIDSEPQEVMTKIAELQGWQI